MNREKYPHSVPVYDGATRLVVMNKNNIRHGFDPDMAIRLIEDGHDKVGTLVAAIHRLNGPRAHQAEALIRFLVKRGNVRMVD
jgi:hypothetical protein